MFIRVISELKRWNRIKEKQDRLPADCFFDIKTSKNALSLWKIDDLDNADDLHRFAVISVLGKNSLQKVTYVLINEDELSGCGLKVQCDDPGCGYISNSNQSFLDHHFDIVCIDHEDFIKIANIIINKIDKNEQDVISVKDVNSAAQKLCDEGIVLKDKLQKSMQDYLDKNK